MQTVQSFNYAKLRQIILTIRHGLCPGLLTTLYVFMFV